MDDLPALEETRPRSVDFAPRAIRPPGRRGPILAGAWALGLALVVGLGVLTREPPTTSTELLVARQTPEGRAAPDAQLPSTYIGALLLRDVVDLASPAPARVEITTRLLDVEGSVLVRAARVEIFLEARANRVLDHATVDVSDPNGGIRPERAATFSASFELPNPRPNGTMWVVVTAYDERGLPLGGTRRPFAVGPLIDDAPTSEEVSRPPGGPPYLQLGGAGSGPRAA